MDNKKITVAVIIAKKFFGTKFKGDKKKRIVLDVSKKTIKDLDIKLDKSLSMIINTDAWKLSDDNYTTFTEISFLGEVGIFPFDFYYKNEKISFKLETYDFNDSVMDVLEFKHNMPYDKLIEVILKIIKNEKSKVEGMIEPSKEIIKIEQPLSEEEKRLNEQFKEIEEEEPFTKEEVKKESLEKEEKIKEEELLKQIPEENILSMYKTIEKQLKDEGGIVRIYDSRGKEIASGNSKSEVINKLNTLAKTQKFVYLGKDYAMVQLKKSEDDLPMIESSLLTNIRGLNPDVLEEREILFKIKDMVKRGFNANDMKEIAKDMFNKKINNVIEKKTEPHITNSRLRKQGIKTLSIKDLESIRDYVKNKKI